MVDWVGPSGEIQNCIVQNGVTLRRGKAAMSIQLVPDARRRHIRWLHWPGLVGFVSPVTGRQHIRRKHLRQSRVSSALTAIGSAPSSAPSAAPQREACPPRDTSCALHGHRPNHPPPLVCALQTARSGELKVPSKSASWVCRKRAPQGIAGCPNAARPELLAVSLSLLRPLDADSKRGFRSAHLCIKRKKRLNIIKLQAIPEERAGRMGISNVANLGIGTRKQGIEAGDRRRFAGNRA